MSCLEKILLNTNLSFLWSAICFKIMTRYTCGFFPRILAIIPAKRYTCVFLPRILAFFPALWGFYSQVYDHYLTNAHIYAHKQSLYTAISRKVVGKNVHAIIPKGNMGYVQYTAPDTVAVEPTLVAFL